MFDVVAASMTVKPRFRIRLRPHGQQAAARHDGYGFDAYLRPRRANPQEVDIHHRRDGACNSGPSPARLRSATVVMQSSPFPLHSGALLALLLHPDLAIGALLGGLGADLRLIFLFGAGRSWRGLAELGGPPSPPSILLLQRYGSMSAH